MIKIKPVMSIIVPIYNIEKYLRQCVDSILAQNFTNFEVLLVDDGSQDKCPAICDEYATKDERVKVIHSENCGVSSARNKGIDLSIGEYIAFVDGDDVLAVNYCEMLYNAIVKNQVVMAACKIERFSSDDCSIDKASCDKISVISYEKFLKMQMSGKLEISVCNKLFHKSVFKNIRFWTKRRYEDIIFAADLLGIHLGDVVYVDSPLYYYRQQADSFMNRQVNTNTCNADRIFAGNYLVTCARKAGYEHMDECFLYAIKYPWYFVDPTYVHFRFKENWKFLSELQGLLRDNCDEYRKLTLLDDIQRKRMMIFARSKILYGVNAYIRLFRVYLYHVLGLDAYADGHGI